MSVAPTYVTDMDDYIILSNFDITIFIEERSPEKIQNRRLKRKIKSTANNRVYPMFPDLKISNNNDNINGSPSDINKTTAIVSSNNGIRCVPRSIREKLEKHWIQTAHIQTFSRSLITRDKLRSRVTGGHLLAYHYKECDIGGNICIYYGFLPTMFLHLRARMTTSSKTDSVGNIRQNTDRNDISEKNYS